MYIYITDFYAILYLYFYIFNDDTEEQNSKQINILVDLISFLYIKVLYKNSDFHT